MKFFKENKDFSLTSADLADIDDYLEPLFDYMNANLEVLMSNLEEKSALAVVSGVWNRFILDAEALVVPTLGDDSKDRKQWDERRFQFFAKYLEVLWVDLDCSRIFHG